jgi:hypothetical protein
MCRDTQDERLESAALALRVALCAVASVADGAPGLRALRFARNQCATAERAIEAAMVAVECESEGCADRPAEGYDTPR